MARKGPCRHCKTTKTQMWRRGPRDKPVLCNACGLWWKKTRKLENYLPKYSDTTGNSWHTGFPKRKRSVLQKYTASPVERFRRQLLDVLQKPESFYLAYEQPNDFIYHNHHNSHGEMDLGCVLMSSTNASKK